MVNSSYLMCLFTFTVVCNCNVTKGLGPAVSITKERSCFTGKRDQQRRSAELTMSLKSGNVRANQKLACVSLCLAEKYGLIDKITRDIKRSAINKIIDTIPDPSIKSVASNRSYDCISKAWNHDVCSKIAQLIDCFARDGAFTNWNGDLNAILTNSDKPVVSSTASTSSSTVLITSNASTTSSPVKSLSPTFPSPVPVPAPPTILPTTTSSFTTAKTPTTTPNTTITSTNTQTTTTATTTNPPTTTTTPPVTLLHSSSTVTEEKSKPTIVTTEQGNTDAKEDNDASTNTAVDSPGKIPPDKTVPDASEGNDGDAKDVEPPVTSPEEPTAGVPEESDKDQGGTGTKNEDQGEMENNRR